MTRRLHSISINHLRLFNQSLLLTSQILGLMRAGPIGITALLLGSMLLSCREGVLVLLLVYCFLLDLLELVVSVLADEVVVVRVLGLPEVELAAEALHERRRASCVVLLVASRKKLLVRNVALVAVAHSSLLAL